MTTSIRATHGPSSSAPPGPGPGRRFWGLPLPGRSGGAAAPAQEILRRFLVELDAFIPEEKARMGEGCAAIYRLEEIRDHREYVNEEETIMLCVEGSGFDLHQLRSTVKGEAAYRTLCEETQTRFIEMQQGLSSRIQDLEAEKIVLLERVEELEDALRRSVQKKDDVEEPLRNGFVTTRRTPPIEQRAFHPPPRRKKGAKKPPGVSSNNRRASYGGVIEYRGPSQAEGRRSLGSEDGAIVSSSTSSPSYHRQQQQQAFTSPPTPPPALVTSRPSTGSGNGSSTQHPRTANSLLDYRPSNTSSRILSSGFNLINVSTRTQGGLTPRTREGMKGPGGSGRDNNNSSSSSQHWTASFGSATGRGFIAGQQQQQQQQSRGGGGGGLRGSTGIPLTPVQSRSFCIAPPPPPRPFQPHQFSPRTVLSVASTPPPHRVAPTPRPTSSSFYEAPSSSTSATQHMFRVPLPSSSMTQIPRPSSLTLRPPPSSTSDVSRLISSQSSLAQQQQQSASNLMSPRGSSQSVM